MLQKQAKILTRDQLDDLLVYAGSTRHPQRDRLIVLLSVKAGLRAGEIAGLTWDMVLGGDGELTACIELRDHAAKKQSGRRIPLHPELGEALLAWRVPLGPIITSERGGRMRAGSVVLWFARAFRAIGLHGCSSHSGRRTFITRAARSGRSQHLDNSFSIPVARGSVSLIGVSSNIILDRCTKQSDRDQEYCLAWMRLTGDNPASLKSIDPKLPLCIHAALSNL